MDLPTAAIQEAVALALAGCAFVLAFRAYERRDLQMVARYREQGLAIPEAAVGSWGLRNAFRPPIVENAYLLWSVYAATALVGLQLAGGAIAPQVAVVVLGGLAWARAEAVASRRAFAGATSARWATTGLWAGRAVMWMLWLSVPLLVVRLGAHPL